MARPSRLTFRPEGIDKDGYDSRLGEEYITATEFAKRMGKTTTAVFQWLENGRVFRTRNKKFVWPLCKNDYESSRQCYHKADRDKIAKKAIPPAKNGDELSDENFAQPPSDEMRITPRDVRTPALVKSLIKGLKAQKEWALAGTFKFAKTFDIVLKVEKEQAALLKREGQLIDRDAVTNTLLTKCRHERNIWLNMPELVATEFAQEAGIDTRLAHDLLKKYVHKTLEQIAKTRPDEFTTGS